MLRLQSKHLAAVVVGTHHVMLSIWIIVAEQPLLAVLFAGRELLGNLELTLSYPQMVGCLKQVLDVEVVVRILHLHQVNAKNVLDLMI